MAQQINCDLCIRFSKTGKPLIVILDTGASYTVQLVIMTLSHENTKKRKNQKVVTYREMMSGYMEDNNLNIEGSELERVLSPQIQATNSQLNRDKITPTITDKDLDDIAATLARKNNEKNLKKPESVNPANINEINPENSFVQLSQYEQDECESIIRDAALFSDEMEIDPVFEPPKRLTEHSLNLDSYRLQASREKLLDMQRIPEEPHSEEIMEEIDSHNIVPSDPKAIQMEIGYKLSTQEKREMKNIKNIFTTRGSQLSKLKDAKDLCPGSDSEESIIDE